MMDRQRRIIYYFLRVAFPYMFVCCLLFFALPDSDSDFGFKRAKEITIPTLKARLLSFCF